MAYVYRHIRLDKNIPFYIGIGNDETYARANDKKGRNSYWGRIVAKAGYEVEIIMDNISWEQACKKEIEFIFIYGRKKDGGILANITKGGEGKLGVAPVNGFPKGHTPWTKGKKIPREQVEKLAAINRGRPSWNRGKTPSAEAIAKRLRTIEINGGFPIGEKHPMFGKTHSDELKARWRIIRKGAPTWNKGVPMEVAQKEKMRAVWEGRSVPIDQYDLLGAYIKTFPSLNDAMNVTGVRKGNISHCLKGNRNSAGGYIWKIKKPDESPAK